MDPVSALSLTSSIVTFVDFACKLVAGSHAIYRSVSGLSEGGRTLDVISQDFHRVTADLWSSRDGQSQDRSASDLQELLDECTLVADSLRAALDRLRASGPKKRWKSFKAALREVWSKDAMDTLVRRLTMLQSQLNLRLLSHLRTDQSAIQQTLTRLEIQNQALEMGQNIVLRDMELNIVSAITQLDKRSTDNERPPVDEASINAGTDARLVLADGLGKVAPALSDFAAEGRKVALQQSILRGLRFSMMEVRLAKVAAAHGHTFEWIFRDSGAGHRSAFVEWLETGDKNFWIFGKPGSGKSTLMKFMCQSEQLSRHLRVWAGEAKLVFAKFFFWNAGSELQKSLEGLLRSLLFEILREAPGIILRIPALQAKASLVDAEESWQLHDLEGILRLIVKDSTLPARFCFFIDGLDEYERTQNVELMDLIDLLQDLSSSKNIKLCISSRPWNIFRDAYAENPSLKLEDLTRGDISDYVRDKFAAHRAFKQRTARDTRYAELTQHVIAKAQGVFLWVYLVVRSLMDGFTNGDDISKLQERVDLFPSDLEDFFQHILDSVDPFYKRQTLNTLDLVLNAREPPTLMMYSFLNDPVLPKPNLDLPASPVWIGESRHDCAMRMEEAQRRLDAQCKGLVEVVSAKGIFLPCCRGCNSKVDLLHRTVKDFLCNPKLPICLELASNSEHFDLGIFLIKAQFASFQYMAESVPRHNYEQCRPFIMKISESFTGLPGNGAKGQRRPLQDQLPVLLGKVLAKDANGDVPHGTQEQIAVDILAEISEGLEKPKEQVKRRRPLAPAKDLEPLRIELADPLPTEGTDETTFLKPLPPLPNHANNDEGYERPVSAGPQSKLRARFSAKYRSLFGRLSAA